MNKNFAALMAVMITLTGCGGGGGTSSPVPATPAPVVTPAPAPVVIPSPTVTLALSQSKVSLGNTSTVTWSSTNATSCMASGAWSGTQAISGTSIQTPTTSGASAYTLICTGAGGSANQTATLIVPIPVLKSSYENKVAVADAIGQQILPREVWQGNAVAFADFFQDGTYSMVTHSLEYNSQDQSTSGKFGHIHFWQKISGSWVDNTPKLLSSNLGCLHPRKAVVADFNGDGVPDVFFACHGFDASPFPGESPHLLLSQADGTYKNMTLPVTCFCHSATAADVNGDGFPDVLVADNMIQHTPFFLINNKDGTFTKDLARIPPDAMNKPIFTTEMIDFNQSGKYDVFLGGHEQDPSVNWPATILPNDGSGGFTSTTRVILPSLQGYGFPLDIVFKNGNIYLPRTVDASANFYQSYAIQKVAYPALTSSLLYQHSGPYSNGVSWVNWIIPSNGNVVNLDSVYGVSVPQ